MARVVFTCTLESGERSLSHLLYRTQTLLMYLSDQDVCVHNIDLCASEYNVDEKTLRMGEPIDPPLDESGAG